MIRKGAKTATLSDMPEPITEMEEESSLEEMEEEALRQYEQRKNARLRTRGPYRKARIEAKIK
jgi:hypothetical protein